MAFNFFFFLKSISGSQSCLCFLTLGKTDTLELQLKEGNSLPPQTRKWWLISEMKRRHASQGLNRAICCGHDLGLGFWGRHSLEYIIWYSDFLGCDLWAASVYLWDCLELEGKEELGPAERRKKSTSPSPTKDSVLISFISMFCKISTKWRSGPRTMMWEKTRA